MNFITLNLLSVLSHALQNQNRNKEEISERLPCVIEMHHRKYYGFSNVWDSAIHRIIVIPLFLGILITPPDTEEYADLLSVTDVKTILQLTSLL